MKFKTNLSKIVLILLIIVMGLTVIACNESIVIPPTPTPTESPESTTPEHQTTPTPSPTFDVTPTPSELPTPTPSPLPTPTKTPGNTQTPVVPDPTVYTLRINEVIPENKVYRTFNGEINGIIEIYNYGSAELSLDRVIIKDGKYENSLKGVTLGAGEYLVILASGNGRGILEDNSFDISYKINSGETLKLVREADGKVISELFIPKELEDNYSLSYKGTFSGISGKLYGDYVSTTLVTPGFENSIEGLSNYFDKIERLSSPLVINEVLTSNVKYSPLKGEYYDIVEIKNVSENDVNLSDFYLSDKLNQKMKFHLPDKVLKPGQVVIIYCTGDSTLNNSSCAPFKLSSDGESLYIFSKAGDISDAAYLSGLTFNGSYGRVNGRSGFFYFETPTPGKDNTSGKYARAVAEYPEPSVTPGVYNQNGEPLNINFLLGRDKVIRYTLDGSEPTADSNIYSTPFVFSGSRVIRISVSQKDRLDLGIQTLSYILNENHTLPVINISINNELMFGEEGIYPQKSSSKTDYEYGANISFFEEDGWFSYDCGIKLFGNDSRDADKKSFKIKFRSKYGTSSLKYDIFGGDEITEFKSLRLRAGEDHALSLMRDEVVSALAYGNMGNMLVQNYRYCILYINGEYFGIYVIRTDTKEDYIGEKHGVDSDDVNLAEIIGYLDNGNVDEFVKLVNYARTKDMSIQSNYDYFASRVDIDSLIDWFFVQAYTGNQDVGNIRYYQFGDGKWTWIMYDFDWAFYNRNTMFVIKSDPLPSGVMLRSLIKNEGFKDKLIEKFAYHLKNTFTEQKVLDKVEELYNIILPEIERDRVKNNELNQLYSDKKLNRTVAHWKMSVQSIRDYIPGRNKQVANDLIEYFSLTNEQIKDYGLLELIS